MKAQAVKVKDRKELWVGLINLALAGISVFLFEYWFTVVTALETAQMWKNFGVIFGATATLFVGKTFYGKGLMNNIKKGLLTFGLAALTIALMLYSAPTEAEAVYPLTGLALVLIAFYMLSLSFSTLTLIGIVGVGMLMYGSIAYAKLYGYIDWSMAGELSKWAMFIILFWGGVWPHFRKYSHGVTGVNKDGGGFGSSEYDGDAGDGDGDTGEE